MLIEKQKVFHARLKLASTSDDMIKDVVDNMDRLSMVFLWSTHVHDPQHDVR